MYIDIILAQVKIANISIIEGLHDTNKPIPIMSKFHKYSSANTYVTKISIIKQNQYVL
jgi:hypothetical protein